MQIFTIRDLRDRTGELVRDAEAGKLWAARLAGLSVVDFMDDLAQLHIPVARPRTGELESELASFD